MRSRPDGTKSEYAGFWLWGSSKSSGTIILLTNEFAMIETTSIASGTLIAAEKVQGTTVYNRAGDKLGSVDDIMIDKVSGHAVAAASTPGELADGCR